MPLMLASGGSGRPFIRFSIENNEWLMSTEGGEPQEFEWTGPVLVDIEKIQLGWMKLMGGRDFVPWPNNDPSVPRPGEEYKQAFTVSFYSTKLFGDEPLREFSSSATGCLEFVKELYDEVERAGGFGKEQCVAIKVGKARREKIGRGPTKIPTFEIMGYKDRPDAMLETKETIPVSSESDDLDDVFGTAAPKKEEADSFENMEI